MIEHLADVLTLVAQFDRSVVDRILAGRKGMLSVNDNDRREAVEHHWHMVDTWSRRVGMPGSAGARSLGHAFVDLDLWTIPRRLRGPSEERGLQVSELADHSGHLVLLGDPGAGKTTALRRLARLYLRPPEGTASARMPLLVRFRELRSSDSLTRRLLGILGIGIKPRESANEDRIRDVLKEAELRVLCRALDHINAVLLLDGLDEATLDSRDILFGQIEALSLGLRKAQVVLTCRTAAFPYNFENATSYELQRLTAPQIVEMATRWLGEEEGKALCEAIGRSPYAGAERTPLTLVQLCVLFERTGEIPERPVGVYEDIVRLFLREWDEARRVRRQTKYPSFDVHNKQRFLRSMAYELTKQGAKGSFDEIQFQVWYQEVCDAFDLPLGEAAEVLTEMEAHSGLILMAGRGNYEFSHKSIQEYLAAAYMLSLPDLDTLAGYLWELPNEWALVLAMSPEPGRHFSRMVAIIARRISSDSTYSNSRLEPFCGELVARVRSERVRFDESEELGAAYVVLYHLLRLWEAPDQGLKQAYLGVAESPSVRRSIGRFLTNSSFSEMESQRDTVELCSEVARYRDPGTRKLVAQLAGSFRDAPEWLTLQIDAALFNVAQLE